LASAQKRALLEKPVLAFRDGEAEMSAQLISFDAPLLLLLLVTYDIVFSVLPQHDAVACFDRSENACTDEIFSLQ
jgi:hypothetical protein